MIGCDDAGIQYKATIKADLESNKAVSSVLDIGVAENETTAYPHIAIAAAEKIANGEADRAILICGTGLGELIVVCLYSHADDNIRCGYQCQQGNWYQSGHSA